MSRVSFYTLGCKLNQAETAMLAEDFIRNGYDIVKFGEQADICVINTCTVTAKSDTQCRQAIRRAVKSAPEAVVVAVGCYSQLESELISKIPGVDLVLGTHNKFDLLQRIEEIRNEKNPQIFIRNHLQKEEYTALNSGEYVGRTRAFLKIQDGCDSYCSYCIVPYARGPCRSASLVDVMHRTRQLIEKGYKEIVLTGVHIGKFGQDRESSLTDLLIKLETIDGVERIRLSSLDPQEITDELVEIIASSKKICQHLHIPLQSGDDDILHAMGRGYTTSDYVNLVEKVVLALPNVGLGTDIIVGFPGETAAQFQHTVELIRNLPLSYLHVFKYSQRPNTAAAKLPDNVSGIEKSNRSQQLRELGQLKKNEFYARQLGTKHRVLFERKQNGYMTGWSDNYLRVAVSHQIKENEMGMVHIDRTNGRLAIGTLVSGVTLQ